MVSRSLSALRDTVMGVAWFTLATMATEVFI